ncbi:MAG: arginine--tRNA ligase [Candidatus Portnoybacteria bacterium]|nr:arginine--tRNA ligase [Candidatus Portnoybacteria bacterium]MDD4982660.1 arginine--tRNA ligase [Candidatus Portnoybacteria bacterium]
MIRSQIQKLLNLPDAAIDRPENPGFGDYSTNAVLKLAKKEGKNPMILAQALVQKILVSDTHIFSKIEVASPGFINFTLSNEFFRQQVAEILKAKENYGAINIGENKKVQVEFISANPTGPLTLGNGRGGFFGDVLANVLARAGFDVKREYFVNDAGYQVEVLGHSVLKDEQAQYKGEYIDKLNKKFICWLCSKDPKKVGQKAAKYILAKMLQPTIKDRMKIKFDEWVSENSLRLSGETDEVLQMLKAKNLTYEQDGAVWFKSTQFGDDKDRVLITSAKDGKSAAATYLLPDAAYHYKKFVKDKFDKVINVWGADHHGYILRLQAVKKALDMPGELEVVIMQLVRLMVKGQEVKMSKRLGTYITLDELLEEIPLDVARFFFLMRAPNTHMDFDLDLAKEQSQKNPVYYVQYAYARICSILRKASESGFPPSGGVRGDVVSDYKLQANSYQLLSHPSELALIKQLIRLPEIIADTATDYGVHRLPQYSMDLVRSFHKFYEDCKVIDETNKDLTVARLALCEATRITLKNTLDLMGISAPEKM